MVYRWTGASPARGAAAAAYAQATEQTLVRGLRQGDNDAYTALYDIYRPRILSFVTRILGDPDDAHDVTQEVFLKAFRRLPSSDRELALKPWLYKVASTTCLDHLRARRRRSETSATICEELPAVGDAYEQAAMSGSMQEALDRLSDRHRLVLILKDLHGLRHEEIAQILGVSRGATETLLFRARAAFRQAYTAVHEGDEPSVAKKVRKVCPGARQAALAFIRPETSPEERQRVLDHARSCLDCRRAVRRGRGTHNGLAALLPGLGLPTWLRPHDLFARLTASSLAGADGEPGGGLLTTIAQAAQAKAAVVVAAATVTVSLSGAAATQRVDGGRATAASAAVATETPSTGGAAVLAAVHPGIPGSPAASPDRAADRVALEATTAESGTATIQDEETPAPDVVQDAAATDVPPADVPTPAEETASSDDTAVGNGASDDGRTTGDGSVRDTQADAETVSAGDSQTDAATASAGDAQNDAETASVGGGGTAADPLAAG